MIKPKTIRYAIIFSLLSASICFTLFFYFIINVETNNDNSEDFIFDISPVEKITYDQKNYITGWGFSTRSSTPVNVKIELNGKILVEKKASIAREDVATKFQSYPQAKFSGFEFMLSMHDLPREIGYLNIILEDEHKNIKTIKGPYLDNNAPIGKVISSSQYIDTNNLENIDLKIWATDENGIKSVNVKIADVVVATPKKHNKTFLPVDFHYKNSAPNQGKYTKTEGNLYELTVSKKDVPRGISRLNVVIEDNESKTSVIAGSLIINDDNQDSPYNKCKNNKMINIYYPVGLAELKEIEKLKTIKKIFTSACVKLGLRTRIEYLRTTTGKTNDYQFDPNFSQNMIINKKSKQTMTGVPLDLALETAKILNVPLLLTLDGGVWADSAFEAAQWDVVDYLEQTKQNVQWNQHDVAEKDDALDNIQSSLSSPSLARMMSLNEYNTEFLSYKKRNLQQAIKYITTWRNNNHNQNIYIHFDPDNYINPWFYNTQWYDYNPLTIKQFREWLTGTGLYNEDANLKDSKHTPSLSIKEINDLSGNKWNNIEEIDPPRYELKQNDYWYGKWVHFKRHLVNQHYVKLHKWSVEAGFDASNIYTGQGIDKDSAAFINDKADSWGDQAGVSMEGAFVEGKGAFIMYGDTVANSYSQRNDDNIFDILDRFGKWGIVEFHPASLAYSECLPSYEESTKILNNFAKHNINFFSPMTGSDAQDQKINPQHFHSFHALAGTKFEDAMVEFVKNYK